MLAEGALMLFTWVRALMQGCFARHLRWFLAASLLVGAVVAGAWGRRAV
jgi:hypothetical protein